MGRIVFFIVVKKKGDGIFFFREEVVGVEDEKVYIDRVKEKEL